MEHLFVVVFVHFHFITMQMCIYVIGNEDALKREWTL